MQFLSYIGQIVTPTPKDQCISFLSFLLTTRTFIHLLSISCLICSGAGEPLRWSTACREEWAQQLFSHFLAIMFPPFSTTWCTIMTDGYLPRTRIEAYKVPFDTFQRQGLALLKWYDTNPTSAYVKEYLFNADYRETIAMSWNARLLYTSNFKSIHLFFLPWAYHKPCRISLQCI